MRLRPSAALAVALALLLAGAGVTAAVTMNGGGQDVRDPAADVQSTDQADAPSRTIQVSARGTAEASPDQAVVRVEVVATGSDAPTARKRLAENTSKMRQALEEAGVGDGQIETLRYDLRRDRRPPRPAEEGERGEPRVRYRGSHSFRITVNDLDETGTVIDTAVRNGADSVEDIRFTLSTERRRELRQDALADATDNARGQAETLAEQSDLEITGVHSVRTTERGYYGPRYEAAAAGGANAGDTSIDTSAVAVQVQVHVTYDVSRS